LTGKSELLKRVAIYAGITMVTQPLAAGELNRPYVGETEKLLVDIMYRAHAIPFLICAMTIDEIDGLVPKRDNNAQQGKVDGISVLLSHIEGVKNIPNLIVFGATNRRNMMDEAFLRRMQAKVFVGRPSPAIRTNMLTPLVCKDSSVFTPKRLESLVKITTNFSGAAIGALKSNLIIEMDRNPNITDHRLLELADSVAREFNVWFGISTLPEICRLNPTIINSTQHEDNYSLDFEKLIPTGRILIDYTDRKCLIEIQNEPTLEKDLEKDETSVPRLLARFIHGCSTRNIDTIQTIDLNFLIKQNAFDENQIFELLTTTFLECNEYNRSMLIFDIDSLIMLNKSDSDMSKSKSISNIRVYQFIREKCKTSIVEKTEANEKVCINS
jgi:SpoVK/Ycf46/Vps4 family AAA+-type ATPase